MATDEIRKTLEVLMKIRVEIPTENFKYHEEILKLQKYLNICHDLSLQVLDEIYQAENDEPRLRDLKNLARAVDKTYEHLKLTKQNFNMIINKGDKFEGGKGKGRKPVDPVEGKVTEAFNKLKTESDLNLE